MATYNPIIERMNERFVQAQAERAALIAQMQAAREAQAAQPSAKDLRRLELAKVLAESQQGTPQSDYLTAAPWNNTTPEVGGAWNALMRGVDMAQLGFYGGISALGDLIGADSMRDWAMKRAWANEDEIEANPARYGRFEDNVHSLGDFGGWATERALESLPSMLPAIAGTIATGGAGAIPIITGTTGLLEGGQNYVDAVNEHGTAGASAGTALGLGALAGALEAAGPLRGATRALGETIRGAARKSGKELSEQALRQANDIVSETIKKSYGKALAKGFAGEAGTEFGQEVLSSINKNLQANGFAFDFDSEDYSNWFNAALAGGVIGGPLGAVGNFGARNRAYNAIRANELLNNINDVSRATTGLEADGLPPSTPPRGLGSTGPQANPSYINGMPQGTFGTLDNNFLNQAQPVNDNFGQSRAETIQQQYEQARSSLDEQFNPFEMELTNRVSTARENLARLQNTQGSTPQEQRLIEQQRTRAEQAYTKQQANLAAWRAKKQEAVDNLEKSTKTQTAKAVSDTFKNENTYQSNVSRYGRHHLDRLASLRQVAQRQADNAMNVVQEAIDRVSNWMTDAYNAPQSLTLNAQVKAARNNLEKLQKLRQNIADTLKEINTRTDPMGQNLFGTVAEARNAHAKLIDAMNNARIISQGRDINTPALHVMDKLSQDMQRRLDPKATHKATRMIAGVPQRRSNTQVEQAMNERVEQANQFARDFQVANTQVDTTASQAAQQSNISNSINQPATEGLPSRDYAANQRNEALTDVISNFQNTNPPVAPERIASAVQRSNDPTQISDYAQRIIDSLVDAFSKKYGLNVNQTTTKTLKGADRKNLGFIDQNGNITIVVDNIVKEANTVLRNDPDAIANVTAATLQHEGLAHYGLRTIFNESELQTYMGNVYEAFHNSNAWKALAKRMEGFDALTPTMQAEEFCAEMAASQQPPKTLWQKLKQEAKYRLQSIGFISPYKVLGRQSAPISEKDIRDTLLAASKNLEKRKKIGPIRLNTTMNRGMSREGAAGEAGPFTNDGSTNDQVIGHYEQAYLDRQNRKLLQKTADAIFTWIDPKGYHEGMSIKNWFEDHFFDANGPIRRMVESIKKAGGTVTNLSNVFKWLEAMPNRMVNEMERQQERYIPRLEQAIQRIIKPGEDAAQAYQRAADYVRAKHSLERNKFIRENEGFAESDFYPSGMSDKEATDIINARESENATAYNEIMEAVQEINRARCEYIRQYKLIPNADETIDAWERAYKYYVPLKYWDELVQTFDPAWYKSDMRRSLSVSAYAQKKLTHRAKGRSQEVAPENPIAVAILQFQDVIQMRFKVEAGRSLLELQRQNQDAKDIFEIVQDADTPEGYRDPDYLKRVTRSGKEINAKAPYYGVKRIYNPETALIEYKRKMSNAEGQSEDVISIVDDNGDIVKLWVKDKAAAAVFKGSNIIQTNAVIRGIGRLTSGLGRLTTSLNPLFWIRNPVRDTMSAAINMSSVERAMKQLGMPNAGDIAKTIFTKGLMSSFAKNSVRQALFQYYRTHKMDFSNFDAATQEMMNELDAFYTYGGNTSFFSNSSIDAINKSLTQSLRDKNPATKFQKGMSTMRSIMEYCGQMSDSLENMTRYIAFKSVVDGIKANCTPDGLNRFIRPDGKKITLDEIRQRAADVAMNLTVNFSKKGSWAPLFNSFYMFGSANLGGAYRTMQTLLSKDADGHYNVKGITAFMASSAATAYMLATLARLIMPDDDDGINRYDKIPDWEKESNFIIPTPNGGYFKIPLAYILNIPYAFFVKLEGYIHSKMTGQPSQSLAKIATDTVGAMFDNFNVMGQTSEGMDMMIPSIFRPLFQITNNRNFAGSPIYPEGNAYVKGEIPDHEKYWSTMNKSVVDFCKVLYDVTGIDVSPESMEHIMNSYTGGFGRILTAGLARLDDFSRGKDLDVGRIPGMNIFYKQSDQYSASAGIYSNFRNQYLTTKNQYKEMLEDPRVSTQERQAFFNENRNVLNLEHRFNVIQTNLNKLRSEERKIDKLNISNREKQKRLDEVKAKKLRLMERFNGIARNAGIWEIQ